MLADHTDTFTANSGAPRKALYRDALHPSPKGTVRLACSVNLPDLPFDPKTALPIRHPLLVAECRCWSPLRFRHVLNARQASTSEGGASSTEMGQLFEPLAVFFPPPPLLQRPADTDTSSQQRRPGDAPLHHQPHRYSRGTSQHRDVGTAQPPFSDWYDTLSEGWPRHRRRSPAMELSRHVDVSVHTGPQPTLPSTHSKPASSCTLSHQLLGGGGGGAAETLVSTQACSVYPAVCFIGSLFLHTPDRCVLVA